ncbi:MAG: hypothetical protein OXT74_16160, partial [Candidatus Poribacteria bacterium]|nr:hypothetical protein [Candidatus Poribacteria bacterium]
MKAAEDWIRFLRKYGPIAQNGNMFDEEIWRAAKRTGIEPITFGHPLAERLLRCFDLSNNEWKSVILTGTAGDGKTHLCRKVWQKLGGDGGEWSSDEPYVMTTVQHLNRGKVQVHVIRDLSAWVPQQRMAWPQEKAQLLLKFSKLLSEAAPTDFFLIAANDGQLIEAWRRLAEHTEDEDVELALRIFDDLLFKGEEEAIGLKFFNLSQMNSSDLFELALGKLLAHERWQECFEGEAAESVTFGLQSPIRRNYELLREPLIQARLRTLFEFCDHNQLHVPIREILLLLANAILGHPDCREGLMIPRDVERVLNNGTEAKASLYSNIFGGNLSATRQESIPVFRYLNLLRIGYETTNRIDNILVFGDTDERLRPYFQKLVDDDSFYGADKSYGEARGAYIEGPDEDHEKSEEFLEALVAQRRALFFKIPAEWEEELKLWDLTVFKHAGTYRMKVFRTLKEGKKVERQIVRRLVKGLNRVWVGMLVDRDQELYLATGLAFSNARVSRLLEEQISVAPRLGQRVGIVDQNGMPTLQVALSKEICCPFPLTLTRFEFLN